jgi:hypothetical protein
MQIVFTAASGTTTKADAILQAIGLSGSDHGTLGVRAIGIPAGTYTVAATAVSSTAAVTLGTFEVKPAPSATTSGTDTPPPPPPKGVHGANFGGPRGIPFPSGFDPFSIASLAISDSNANVLFTADTTTVTAGAYYARTPVVSSTTVTGITGVACVKATANAGVVKGALTVNASGLPASTTYTYALDGVDIATVTTGSAGSLKLIATEAPTGETLPTTVNLFSVSTVTVHDASGNVILSATF